MKRTDSAQDEFEDLGNHNGHVLETESETEAKQSASEVLQDIHEFLKEPADDTDVKKHSIGEDVSQLAQTLGCNALMFSRATAVVESWFTYLEDQAQSLADSEQGKYFYEQVTSLTAKAATIFDEIPQAETPQIEQVQDCTTVFASAAAPCVGAALQEVNSPTIANVAPSNVKSSGKKKRGKQLKV